MTVCPFEVCFATLATTMISLPCPWDPTWLTRTSVHCSRVEDPVVPESQPWSDSECRPIPTRACPSNQDDALREVPASTKLPSACGNRQPRRHHPDVPHDKRLRVVVCLTIWMIWAVSERKNLVMKTPRRRWTVVKTAVAKDLACVEKREASISFGDRNKNWKSKYTGNQSLEILCFCKRLLLWAKQRHQDTHTHTLILLLHSQYRKTPTCIW